MKDHNNRDYIIDIEIDPNDLENELLTHPSKCLYYGERLADAIHNRDRLKTNLKVVQATLDDKVLRNWGQLYERFPSESIREGWVIRQFEYKKALDLYQKAEHNVNLLKSAKEAFDSRGYAIGNLVNIFVAGLQSRSPKTQKVMEENKKRKLIVRMRKK